MATNSSLEFGARKRACICFTKSEELRSELEALRARVAELWKDDIAASKEWAAQQRQAKIAEARAASELPIVTLDSDDDDDAPPKKKARAAKRADNTEAKALSMIKDYCTDAFHADWLDRNEIVDVNTKIQTIKALLSANKPLSDADTEWCVLFYEQYLAFSGRATRD
jgi:hypothetical protein